MNDHPYHPGSYEREMFDFCEAIRRRLGAGYGIGHQLSDLLSIVEARLDVFDRLTTEELSDIFSRPLSPQVAVLSGKMEFSEYRAVVQKERE